jgi:hypothetical protein
MILFFMMLAITLPGIARSRHQNKSFKTVSPFACDVDALTPAERKRHFDELGPLLRSMKTAVRELKNGYEFRFASDQKTFQLVSEWAVQEHLCCPFFRIELRLENEGGPVWLKLTGREGTKEFIRDDFQAWMQK